MKKYEGVERKVDTLNIATTTSVERDKVYLETVDKTYSQGSIFIK